MNIFKLQVSEAAGPMISLETPGLLFIQQPGMNLSLARNGMNMAIDSWTVWMVRCVSLPDHLHGSCRT